MLLEKGHRQASCDHLFCQGCILIWNLLCEKKKLRPVCSYQVETVKKFAAGSNKTNAGKDVAKLDRETEELHHDR